MTNNIVNATIRLNPAIDPITPPIMADLFKSLLGLLSSCSFEVVLSDNVKKIL